MTRTKLNRFREILTGKQADLERGIRGRGALAIETSAEEFDRIQQGQERDLAIGALDRDSRLLRQVRAALNRINTGGFGICLDCEEEIGMKRLAAVPRTSLCIVCQEAADNIRIGQPRVDPELLVA